MAMATTLFWSLARLVHAPGGVIFLLILLSAVESTVGRNRLYHCPQHQKWGLSSSSSAHLGHSHTLSTFSLDTMPGYGKGPGCRYFYLSYAWIWGPQELALSAYQ
jgi:hypothetical protein